MFKQGEADMRNAVNSVMTRTSAEGILAERPATNASQGASRVAEQEGQMVDSFRGLLDRIFARLAFACVYARGKIFGISCVIQYLRNPNPLVSVRLLRAFGASVGEDTTIKRSLILDNVYTDLNSTGDFSHLRIGTNCYLGDCVFFDLADEITLEDNVVVSGNASFVTHADCNRSKFLSERFPRECRPVVVRSGAWIGFGATVLLGVTVGTNSVIGAHSLLLVDANAFCVYVGSPAKPIKSLG